MLGNATTLPFEAKPLFAAAWPSYDSSSFPKVDEDINVSCETALMDAARAKRLGVARGMDPDVRFPRGGTRRAMFRSKEIKLYNASRVVRCGPPHL